MKIFAKCFVALLGLAIMVPGISSASPETEKAFLDTYKKAFEAKDEATLKGLLYTKGADPEILEFFTMMMTGDMGGKISSIELKDLSPEDLKKAAEVHPSPGGGNAKLPVTPSKKLVLKISTSDSNGSSNSSSETFVAEIDGKLMIPVPGPVKQLFVSLLT